LLPLARQLVAGFGGLLPDGLSIRLLVPANWALIRRVELPGVRWSERAAGFGFESFVPVELERLAYTAVRTGPESGLVVAVFALPFQNFFAALAEGGISVERMTVDVFGLSRGIKRGMGKESLGVLYVESDRAVLARSIDRGGLPLDVSAFLLPAVHDSATEQLVSMVLLSEPAAGVWVVDGAAEHGWESVRGELEAVGVRVESVPVGEARAAMLYECAACDDLPDLRRGPLAAPGRWEPVVRRVRRCAWAAVVLLLILAVRLYREGGAYSAAAAAARPVRDAVCAEVFPGVPFTAAAPLLVRSERIKLEGVTERAGGPVRLGLAGLEALDLLGEVVARVPAGMKLDLSEIAVDERVLRLVGRTTSHDAAGALVKSLNAGGRFAGDAPQTKLMGDGTVQFRVVARRLGGDDD
jgi:hypothetical protein